MSAKGRGYEVEDVALVLLGVVVTLLCYGAAVRLKSIGPAWQCYALSFIGGCVLADAIMRVSQMRKQQRSR